MYVLESLFRRIRHVAWLERAEWFWGIVRPVYDFAVSMAGKRGLKRNINNTDLILVAPECRGVGESYEPDVWAALMAEVRAGDVFVDVGAFVGLYAIAVAKRLSNGGEVVAFEPDPNNYAILEKHIRLNGIGSNATAVQCAVGSMDGSVAFDAGRGLESKVSTAPATGDGVTVRMSTLDSVFADRKVDILKVDVEGAELQVLQGGERLLKDDLRRPRVLFIEVHPYAWADNDTTSDLLLTFLGECGYSVFSLSGSEVHEITRYGEVIARTHPTPRAAPRR